MLAVVAKSVQKFKFNLMEQILNEVQKKRESLHNKLPINIDKNSCTEGTWN